MIDHGVIDPQGLEKLRKLGGPAFLKKMIALFLAEAPQRLLAARKGEAVGDLTMVGAAAHSLKSSAMNFGAKRLGTLAQSLEHGASSNSITNLPALLDELEAAFGEVKELLVRELEALQP